MQIIVKISLKLLDTINTLKSRQNTVITVFTKLISVITLKLFTISNTLIYFFIISLYILKYLFKVTTVFVQFNLDIMVEFILMSSQDYKIFSGSKKQKAQSKTAPGTSQTTSVPGAGLFAS